MDYEFPYYVIATQNGENWALSPEEAIRISSNLTKPLPELPFLEFITICGTVVLLRCSEIESLACVTKEAHRLWVERSEAGERLYAKIAKESENPYL